MTVTTRKGCSSVSDYKREKPVESLLRERVRSRGGWSVKLLPSVSGLPDRMVLMPGGVLIFVETKAPTGTVQPHQTVVHGRLRRLGFDVVVLSSRDEVEAWVQQLDSGAGPATHHPLG